ncbi:thioredoxin family protein [Lignipirellula cremea]|uniref:Thiol-disulfide oxidoreductase ResA n=1 Tax=Lignipirellula cremea TaxID=2528010 RepID=A0A518DZL4_9BACT|nr:thioredoxin family protein [Lignipirellula cremea]QDU97273.1 Thiol-disulfide oxidoreductase ResA [Lignipirellula cremea]
MIRSAALSLMAVVLAVPAFAADGVKIGDKAPTFSATDAATGKKVTLEDYKKSKAVVVCFTCNVCPVAIDYEDRFVAFAKEYAEKGVQFVAIDCNGEGIAEMAQRAEEKGFTFPYASDASGDSAIAYGARVTPHLFLLDQDRKVAYIGAFDDSNKGNAKENYLIDAVNSVLEGKTPETQTTRARGCGIRVKRS